MKKQTLIISLNISVMSALFLLALINVSLFIHLQHASETIPLGLMQYIFTSALILLMLISFLFIKLGISSVERESQYNAQQAYIDNIEQLFTALKIQRHEMITHVHTLYGLITEKNYKEAEQYIHDIFEETVALNEIIITNRPELSALIRTKSGIASNRGIKFEVNIQCSLQKLAIKPYELNIILGNVIDNAFDAVNRLDSLPKMVSLFITQAENTYIFRTVNAGSIDQTVADRLFQKGVTSKGTEHMGLGLYLTREFVEKNGGTIDITSDGLHKIVTCLIELPKSKR